MPPVLADRGFRFEAWTNPNATTFKRKFDLSRWIDGWTLAHKYLAISDGRILLPADFPKRAQLMHVDKDDHANDVASIIRQLSGTTPINHFVLKRLDGKWASTGDMLTGALEGMDYFLDRALVPNFDAPATPTIDPDWHYGLPSLLQNAGLEESGLTSAKFQLEVNATAGAFTLDWSSLGTTAAIDWDTDLGNLAIAIEAIDPGNIDVAVSGLGTAANPFVIEFLVPGQTDVGTFSADSSGLTGLASPFTVQVGGASLPYPWTRSYHPTAGIYHGTYFDFETSTAQAHSGTHSLYVNGDLGDWPTSYPGAQQFITVTGGRHYDRVSVWVYPEFSARYRFIIRTEDETEIGKVEADLTAGSWQQLVISGGITAPSHVDKVIFRVACIANVHGVQEFYVDDAMFAPGFDEATFGKMMGDLLAAVQAIGYLTWVTKTWTDTHDSAGNLWDAARKWSIRHRQSLLQVVEYADRWNYESSGLYWDQGQTRFEWGLFNPGAGGTNHQGTGLAVIGKQLAESGTISTQIPDAATYYAEGDAGYWGEHTDADLEAAWGPLQKAYFNNQSLDEAGQADLAERLVEEAKQRTEGLVTRLSASPVKPWLHFQPGSRNVMVNLAPKRARQYMRCMAIVATKNRDQAAPVYDVHWDAVVLVGEAAHLETTRRLVRALQVQPPIRTFLDGRPAQALVGSGTYQVFSLPGQAFVEVGRLRLQWPYPVAILGVSLAAGVAPTGASLICDANRNGISGVGPTQTIYTDPGQRPLIAAGAKGGLEAIPSLPLFDAYEQFTIDLDQVGSTIPGGDVTVMVRWAWRVPL